MKTFILMSKMVPHGPTVLEAVSKTKTGPRTRRAWIDKVKQKCPEVKFTAHYALLGSWDFMDIYEAPDEETAAKVSMYCSASAAFQVESWVAIPDRRLAEIAEEVEE
jgi:uncharacterized protein with GYD domain